MSLAVKKAKLTVVDQARLEANGRLNPTRKVELGQFMMLASVAQFMAGLFSERQGAVQLLDAGAGVGSLTDAFINLIGKPERLRFRLRNRPDNGFLPSGDFAGV